MLTFNFTVLPLRSREGMKPTVPTQPHFYFILREEGLPANGFPLLQGPMKAKKAAKPRFFVQAFVLWNIEEILLTAFFGISCGYCRYSDKKMNLVAVCIPIIMHAQWIGIDIDTRVGQTKQLQQIDSKRPRPINPRII